MINTLTLNPAMDHNLRLVNVEKGITNRAYDTFDTVGGKGTHVSMNLSQMGLENRAFGICRGKTGQAIISALKELGVTTCFVERENLESRTNYILIEDNNTCTTIAEKGPELTEGDISDLYALLLEKIQPGDTLVLSGDASNCRNPRIYNEIAQILKFKGVRIILDASGESLRNGLESAPYLIKPNEDELEMLCGFSMKTDEDVIRGINSLEAYGIEVIAVSLGKRGSVVKIGKDC
ncbi:MAG: 1-phosphofructokinase family hexose kinase, partial [Clostridia bacterium]|nr:1-phosphofructokinase family hexose kinase [Clostridia bacterium]